MVGKVRHWPRVDWYLLVDKSVWGRLPIFLIFSDHSISRSSSNNCPSAIILNISNGIYRTRVDYVLLSMIYQCHINSSNSVYIFFHLLTLFHVIFLCVCALHIQIIFVNMLCVLQKQLTHHEPNKQMTYGSQ